MIIQYFLRKNKLVIISILLCISQLTYAKPNHSIDLEESIESKLIFKNQQLMSSNIDEKNLPKPYNYLLTQPLMTIGLEHYYQRTAMIKVLDVKNNKDNGVYKRTILMLIDSQKKRNNVQQAQIYKEAVSVEVALITINFNELPKNIVSKIIHTNMPFGKLIKENNIETYGTDRQYFAIECDPGPRGVTERPTHLRK